MRRMTLVFALLLPLVGCLGSRVPTPTDPAKGREALKSVLDAWVKGGKPADLKNASPAIVVSDPDWEEGQQLLQYDIDPTDRRAGVDLRLTATLTLKNRMGKSVRKAATYAISTGAQTTVLRNDPDS